MARAWEEALGVAGVGPQDGWFALGGTSLTAVRMLRTLQQTLGASADGDEFKPGNQRFATRLCGLYRRPRLRDFAVWLDWAAVGAPNRSARDEEALREFSGAGGGGLRARSPGEGAAWLAATDGAAAGGGEAAALEAAEALRAAAAAGSARGRRGARARRRRRATAS